MEIRLGESIRRLRKEAGYTQEQLAEALGVSVSAVHKWETGKSTPELEMLVDIAEFFETSVDTLLNYGWEKQSMGQAARRLRQFCVDKEWDEGMRFAEKALQKYPNSFEVVLRSAEVYFWTLKPEHMPRAVELYERAMLLSEQNDNAQLSAMSIQNRIASCYTYMDRIEDAIEIWKQNNLNGMNHARIGLILSKDPQRADEALGYLSDALMNCYSELYNIGVGYANVYHLQRRLDKITPLILGLYELGNGLRDPRVISWMDRGNVLLFMILAESYRLQGHEKQAFEWLKRAKETARRFDEAPEYRVGAGIKFYYGRGQAACADDMGETAMDIIKNLLEAEELQKLRPLWETLLTAKES